MNFSPFGNHFPSAIPSIHQFTAKFTHEASSTNVVGTQTSLGSSSDEVSSSNRYPNHFTNQQVMPVKYQRDSSTQISGNSISSSPNNSKYQSDVQQYPNVPLNYNAPQRQEQGEQKRQSNYEENVHQREICNLVKREGKEENGDYPSNIQHSQPGMPPSWQSIAAPGSTVADYLSHLPASTLPISLHHFLKYSAESIKKDMDQEHGHPPPLPPPQHDLKKKKKKKSPKEKKPRPKPGEIRLTTALDGSTLYCCPECHMAYPDKSLLEQHLLGHTMERRFFCDICGAGLKRKDHLTRHKQSHNPERPFVCTVCMKAFKRKEQLTLHFVIHSGEKRHVCTECGKGFYRKDHLRKHTRSHIARRVKAEISQHVPTNHTSDRDPMS